MSSLFDHNFSHSVSLTLWKPRGDVSTAFWALSSAASLSPACTEHSDKKALPSVMCFKDRHGASKPQGHPRSSRSRKENRRLEEGGPTGGKEARESASVRPYVLVSCAGQPPIRLCCRYPCSQQYVIFCQAACTVLTCNKAALMLLYSM